MFVIVDTICYILGLPQTHATTIYKYFMFCKADQLGLFKALFGHSEGDVSSSNLAFQSPMFASTFVCLQFNGPFFRAPDTGPVSLLLARTTDYKQKMIKMLLTSPQAMNLEGPKH